MKSIDNALKLIKSAVNKGVAMMENKFTIMPSGCLPLCPFANLNVVLLLVGSQDQVKSQLCMCSFQFNLLFFIFIAETLTYERNTPVNIEKEAQFIGKNFQDDQCSQQLLATQQTSWSAPRGEEREGIKAVHPAWAWDCRWLMSNGKKM